MSLFATTIVATLGLVAAQDGNWTLHKLTDAAATTGAVCLDGSPAAYVTFPCSPPRGRADKTVSTGY